MSGLTFRPAIARPGFWYEFPRPIPHIRMQESWDAERMKVPLNDGDLSQGQSRNGIEITLRGQVGSQGSTLKLTEEAMFRAIEELRTALHVGRTQSKFDFYLYGDAATGEYRHFKDCYTVKLEYDLSDERLFTYSAILHADNPELYRVGP